MAERQQWTGRATGVQQRAVGSLSDEIMERIRARSPDPSVLDEHPPFVWSAVASTGALDCYMTRMAPSSLQNYARDAASGVSFCDSHQRRRLPLGATVDGTYDPAGEGSVTVISFTIPGLTSGALSSDSFIAGVRAGIVRDVSISFLPGSFRCSVCGADPYAWASDCTHAPGTRYRAGKPNEAGEMCFAWVDDARLSEVSAVFDGATPGAAITDIIRGRAGLLVDSGRLSPEGGAALVRSADRLRGGRVDSEPHSVPARYRPGHQTGTRPGHREYYEIGAPEQYRMPGGRW